MNGVSPAAETAVHGVEPHAVIDSILERAARRRAGVTEPDGRKLGLVIEGGALRAVSSAGGAVVLAQLGFSTLFDEVYATSAAVMNASYFIANQPLLGISVYFDECTTRRFINPLRFWKVVDVDYIFDHVAAHVKPLDVGRVMNATTRLFVAVLDKQTGEALMIDTKATRTPLLRVLKASAALPVFYNRTVDVEGRRCMDGGLAIPFGVREALERGCTHVLVLSTRPVAHRDAPPGRLSRLMFDVICAHGNRAIRRRYAERHLRSAEARDLACGRAAPLPTARIATICTGEGENIHRLTTDRSVLRGVATSYGRKVLRLFGGDAAAWSLPQDCAGADASSLREAPLLPDVA